VEGRRPGPAGALAEQMEANRLNWEERTAIHVGSRFYDVEGWLASGAGPKKRETDALGDVTGLRLVHLQCHFGKDTLSWARAGAIVTGLDFSPTAIDFARDLAARAGLSDRSEFVCANVYDARQALGDATFDIVYVSLGALCWLPDIDRWAEQVGELLSAGGRFYIHEQHPLAWSLSDDGLAVEYTYFEESEPFIEDSDVTYTDAERPIENQRTYEWNHSLGEIVTALLSRGLVVDCLVEHDWTVWPRFSWLVRTEDGQWTMPPGMPRIPLTFTLVATKQLDGS
jgi:SAM-dependent methyltransferase